MRLLTFWVRTGIDDILESPGAFRGLPLATLITGKNQTAKQAASRFCSAIRNGVARLVASAVGLVNQALESAPCRRLCDAAKLALVEGGVGRPSFA